MILALFFFLSDEWYARIFGGAGRDGSGTYLGNIALSTHDVRYKRGRHFDWERSPSDQKIFVGDSVFVGANSKATVRIGDSDLNLDENTLVRFSQNNGKPLADLVSGVFQLKVGSDTQVSINGVMTTFKGSKDSTVEIAFDENSKPKVKVLRGNVEVKTTEGKNVATTKLSSDGDLVIAKATPKAATFYFPPAPAGLSRVAQYTWKLSDIYNTENNQIRFRPFKLSQVRLPTNLAWTDSQPGPYFVEFSSDAKFDPKLAQRKSTNTQSTTVETVLLGENFWRVSRDEKDWSQIARLNVVTGYNGEAPRFNHDAIPVWLVNDSAPTVRFEWETAPEYKGYVLEGSQDGKFPSDATQVYWKAGNYWQGTFKTAGTYYFRLRGVHQNMELTEYGKTLKLKVEVPPLLEAPKLADNKEFTHGRPAYLKWTGPEGAEGYRVTLRDASGNSLLNTKLKSPRLSVSDLPASDYTYDVAAIDRWGREGLVSPPMAFKMKAPPPPPAPPKQIIAEEKAPPRTEVEPTREPAFAQPASTSRLRTERPLDFQPNYRRSFVQIEGASAVFVSSEQLTFGTEMPLLGTVALRGLHWWKNNGAEASMKMKAFGYNAAAENAAPLQMEARMHHRWITPWTWFKFLHELQVSVLGGLEVYRNGRGGELYSKGYELAKGGFSLKFPLGVNWDTGGEVLYGLGFDASKKYEISGGLNYTFQRKWAFGVGYRVHYFEAGSMSSTPYVLPYREAQGEGFSVLRYSY